MATVFGSASQLDAPAIRSRHDKQKIFEAAQVSVRKPGHVQPDGALLIFSDLRRPPVAYSQNVVQFFLTAVDQSAPDNSAFNSHAVDLQQLQLSALFSQQDVVRLHKALVSSEEQFRPTSIILSTAKPSAHRQYLCLCHRLHKHVYFEFLPAPQMTPHIYLQDEEVSFDVFLARVMSRARILQQSHGLAGDPTSAVAQHFAYLLRTLTGFDRVILHRFLPDWASEVIAESQHEASQFPNFMGKQFAQELIGAHARAMFQLLPFSHISDTLAPTVPLVCSAMEQQAHIRQEALIDPFSFDLTFAYLRGATSETNTMLHGMGVRASAVFPLVVDGQLWGLFACHHSNPMPSSYCRLVQGEILVQQFVGVLAAQLQREALNLHYQLAGMFRRISAAIVDGQQLFDVLQKNAEVMMGICQSDGFAVCLDRVYVRLGDLPGDEAITALSDWLEPQMNNGFYATDRLKAQLPDFRYDLRGITGMLAVGGQFSISSGHSLRLLWFRRETVREIHWVGQSVQAEDDQSDNQTQNESTTSNQLSTWSEVLKGCSARWDSQSAIVARELFAAIIQVMALQYFRLDSVNRKLTSELSAKNEFFLAICRELLEPLQSFLQLPSQLQSHFAEAAAQKDLQLILQKAADQAATLDMTIHNFRASMLFDTGPVDIGAVDLENEISQFQQQHFPGIRQLNYVTRPLPVIYAAKSEVRLIISTLFAYFMRFHTVQEQCQLQVAVEVLNSEQVWFMFEDNGPDLDHGRRKSLELALLSRIISRYGGTVSLMPSSLKTISAAKQSQDSFGVRLCLIYPKDIRLANHSAQAQ